MPYPAFEVCSNFAPSFERRSKQIVKPQKKKCMAIYQFKQDLAMAYFDGCSKKTASRLLAREINLTPGLLDALRPTGYRPAQKRLSPRQLQILFSFLGEP